MRLDRIDNSIRDKLKNHPTSVDTGDLWKKIERKRSAQAHKNGKRNYRVFLLFIAFLVGTGLVSLSKWADLQSGSEARIISEAGIEQAPAKNKTNGSLRMHPDQTILKTNKKSALPLAIKSNHSKTNTVQKPSSVFNKENVDVKNNTGIKSHRIPEKDPPLQQAAIQKTAALPKLPGKEIDLLEVERTRVLPSGQSTLFPLSTSSSKKIKSSYTILFSPRYPLKKYSSNGGDYQALNDRSIQSLESWSAGFLYHVRIRDRIQIASGLLYQRTVERLSWESSNTTIVNRNGAFFQQNIHRSKRHFNTIEHLDIPLLIGYLHTKNRWTYGLRTGILFNIRQKARGELPAPDLEPGRFISINEEVFKKRIAPAFLANVQIGYQLTPTLNLSLTPGITWQNHSIMQPDFALQQRYAFINMGLELNWLIN